MIQLNDLRYSIGERVLFRSLRWEVAEASDQVVRLYGREGMNHGVEVQVLPGFEPIERMLTPPLQYSIGLCLRRYLRLLLQSRW